MQQVKPVVQRKPWSSSILVSQWPAHVNLARISRLLVCAHLARRPAKHRQTSDVNTSPPTAFNVTTTVASCQIPATPPLRTLFILLPQNYSQWPYVSPPPPLTARCSSILIFPRLLSRPKTSSRSLARWVGVTTVPCSPTKPTPRPVSLPLAQQRSTSTHRSQSGTLLSS